MSEQLVWTEEEIAEMKERFQRRFGEPLPRTESLFAVAAVGYRKGLNTRPSPTEIEALRAEVERLNRILGRIVEGDGDSTVTIRAGTDAFAAAREYLSAPKPAPYDRKRIAWELERTAMGDGYYGSALRAAKEFPEATPSVRALLDRWATGKEGGLHDRTDLCAFALQIYMSDMSDGEPGDTKEAGRG